MEGVAKVLAESLQLKNDSHALFLTELRLTGHTRVPAAKAWLEWARAVEGMGRS